MALVVRVEGWAAVARVVAVPVEARAVEARAAAAQVVD